MNTNANRTDSDNANNRTAKLIKTDQTDEESNHSHSNEGNDSCRPGCGACCIAPSISSPIPGMPQGKPAGVRCQQLDDNNLCRLFGDSQRPDVCRQFTFDRAVCGTSRQQALNNLTWLEGRTFNPSEK